MSLTPERLDRLLRLLFAVTTLGLAGIALRFDLGFWWFLIFPVYGAVFFALALWAYRRDIANLS